jgi:acetyl-CoA synthetase
MWGKLYGQWLCEAAIFSYDFDKFEAADILPMFKRYGITTFCAPPTMYRFFIKEDLAKYDLSGVKYATIAGEALNPEVMEQFYKATGLRLMEGFGQTETTLVCGNLVGDVPKPGSMGKASPQYDVDLILPDGRTAKTGEVGEICIRTHKGAPVGMFQGYYNNKKKTDEVWNNGVYHTGDLAWKDEENYYFIVGRNDDLIKSSGYRIGPVEVESVIMELPYVVEVAVIGVPDEIRGQAIKAVIVLTAGTVASDELKKEIQSYVKSRTAPYKYPRHIDFATALPKTISGKIIRSALK